MIDVVERKRLIERTVTYMFNLIKTNRVNMIECPLLEIDGYIDKMAEAWDKLVVSEAFEAYEQEIRDQLMHILSYGKN